MDVSFDYGELAELEVGGCWCLFLFFFHDGLLPLQTSGCPFPSWFHIDYCNEF